MAQLEECKALHGHTAAASRTEALLKRILRLRVTGVGDLVRLHETLLFLRAYPATPEIVRLCDELLCGYARRLGGFSPADLKEFEYADISGIAGTGLTTNFSYVFARSLADRHAIGTSKSEKRRSGDLHIDWDQYERPDRLASTLAELIPEAREAWAVGRHADWRKLYEAAGGNIRWLLDRVRPEVYDLLEIPLRFELGDSNASRSRARIPRHSIFYHDGPFLARRDVSFEAEFAAPKIPVRRLSRADAAQILGVMVDTSAVRYRELYGFEYPDGLTSIRPISAAAWISSSSASASTASSAQRYHAGMYFKNGVPIGYVEVISVKNEWKSGSICITRFVKGRPLGSTLAC